MTNIEKQMTEKESLQLITTMINRARDSFHDTGVGAIMWGSVIAICSLVKLSELHFGYRLPFDIYYLTLAAIIPQIWMTIREKRQRRARSHNDAFMDYLWLGFAISIVLMNHVISLVLRDLRPVMETYYSLPGDQPAFAFYEFVTPLFLILYGMPTFVTGAACKFRPMLWGGLFCWACSIVTVYSQIKADLLLTALSAILAWFIPGLLMEKEHRLAKRAQQAQGHV